MVAKFDPKAFLQKVGDGQTVTSHHKGAVIYEQRAAANAVFYLHVGRVKLTVEQSGREAIVGLIEAGQFFGEECLKGSDLRFASAAVLDDDSVVASIPKDTMMATLNAEPTFSLLFIGELLKKNSRIEANLVDQLFNSTDKRLARTLLLLSRYGTDDKPKEIVGEVTQEMLAELTGSTRTQVNFFMNKFRRLGFIDYDGVIKVNAALLVSVLQERPRIERRDKPKKKRK